MEVMARYSVEQMVHTNVLKTGPDPLTEKGRSLGQTCQIVHVQPVFQK